MNSSGFCIRGDTTGPDLRLAAPAHGDPHTGLLLLQDPAPPPRCRHVLLRRAGRGRGARYRNGDRGPQLGGGRGRGGGRGGVGGLLELHMLLLVVAIVCTNHLNWNIYLLLFQNGCRGN